ncbi:hypothetical protein A3A79_00555 [Candidatus Gottesmanbacteria bacterium RIFCSPLOWO2_01_FULL_43_11b]|uniref:Prepilin peptidase n=1 Tax=Candidatus Gottesmanbacteria bacterium RIFCSPLOWO2_01_FULL_43_11b TaxID=1798392 RepID=A0A1F6AG85_9BACT|nr:MAG: hypothetical protein A3A79_00555 [Candidatus Gottesmanbacteria bacterium RIFCSPLOWO2_01_FULL_43_11b]
MFVTPIVFFLLGISFGSFMNVLIDRLPRGQTIWGRSHCDHCNKKLRWFELVPIISYIGQFGRCRRCHKRLSLQYPLIELTTGFGFLLLYPQYAFMIIFCALLVIFVADLKYQIIPDSMILVGILGALLSKPYFIPGIGAALFFLLLWIITKGRGMGLGDVKLGFLLGLFLGFPRIAFALYVAFLTGAIVGVILILRKRAGLKSKIAFGPFLILGALISILYETTIRTWFYSP